MGADICRFHVIEILHKSRNETPPVERYCSGLSMIIHSLMTICALPDILKRFARKQEINTRRESRHRQLQQRMDCERPRRNLYRLTVHWGDFSNGFAALDFSSRGYRVNAAHSPFPTLQRFLSRLSEANVAQGPKPHLTRATVMREAVYPRLGSGLADAEIKPAAIAVAASLSQARNAKPRQFSHPLSVPIATALLLVYSNIGGGAILFVGEFMGQTKVGGRRPIRNPGFMLGLSNIESGWPIRFPTPRHRPSSPQLMAQRRAEWLIVFVIARHSAS